MGEKGKTDRTGGTGDGPEYMGRLMKALAEYTAHPEIEHAPVVMTPRQGATHNLARYYYEHEPHKLIAIGYGFGDAGRSQKFKRHNVPETHAHEIRGSKETAERAANNAPPIGYLRTDAFEQAIDHHFNNSKPMFGIMMIRKRLKIACR